MPEKTIHCPKCGSTDIREKNIAYADLPVTEWRIDDDGVPVPNEYDSDEPAEWSFDENDATPYVCGECKEWEGTTDELEIRDATDADKED